MFCIVIVVIWIPCANSVVLIGIFTSYICVFFILATVCVGVSVCACVYIAVYVCLYL